MSDEKQSKSPKQKVQSSAHVYKNKKTVIHELYKLEVAHARKNISWSKSPNWVELEHVHFFHSVDSAGQAQDTCSPVASHFHILKKVKEGSDTDHAEYECSPPMIWVVRDGKRFAKAIPHDDHVHHVNYKHSEPFVQKKINPEAIKVQAAEAAKMPQIPDVIATSAR